MIHWLVKVRSQRKVGERRKVINLESNKESGLKARWVRRGGRLSIGCLSRNNKKREQRRGR